MRVQNINQNNYQNNRQKDIGFKMQAHATLGFHCPKGEPCPDTLLEMIRSFNSAAKKAGAWENTPHMTVYTEIIGNQFDLLLLKLDTYMQILRLRMAGKDAEAQVILNSIRKDEVNTLQLRMTKPTECPNTLIPAENLTKNIAR